MAEEISPTQPISPSLPVQSSDDESKQQQKNKKKPQQDIEQEDDAKPTKHEGLFDEYV